MARKRKTPGGSAAGGESAGNKRARILATQAVAATVAVGLVFLCLTGAIKGFAKHEPSSGVYSFAEGVLDQHWTKTKTPSYSGKADAVFYLTWNPDAQGNATTHVMYPKQNGQSSDVAASNCCARVIGGLECYIGKAVAVVDCNLYVVTDRSKYTTPSFFRMLKSTVGPSRGGWRVRACCSPPANFARFASSRTAADDKGVPLYTQYKELAQRQLRMFVGRGAHKLPHLDFGEAKNHATDVYNLTAGNGWPALHPQNIVVRRQCNSKALIADSDQSVTCLARRLGVENFTSDFFTTHCNSYDEDIAAKRRDAVVKAAMDYVLEKTTTGFTAALRLLPAGDTTEEMLSNCVGERTAGMAVTAHLLAAAPGLTRSGSRRMKEQEAAQEGGELYHLRQKKRSNERLSRHESNRLHELEWRDDVRCRCDNMEEFADKAVAAGEITRLQNSAAKMTNGRDKRTLLKKIRLLISATPGVEPFVESMLKNQESFTRKRQAASQIKKLRTQKSQTKSRRKKGALQLQIDQIIRATPDVESFVNASARGGATRPGMGKHGKKNLGKNLGKEQGLAKGNAEGRAVGKCVGNGTSENQAKRNAAAHRMVPLFCNHICGATAQYKTRARTSKRHLRNAKNGACLAYGLGLEETDFSKYAEMYKYLPKYQAYIEGKDKAKMKNLHPVEGTPVPWR